MRSPVVLITGASGGIGAATAQAFAAAGWQVLAASRHPEQVAPHPQIRALRLDPHTDRRTLAQMIEQDYGGLDCLVNNAGYAQSGPLELLDEAAWTEQLAVNVTAPALLTAALLPALRQARGCVINLSSVLGRTAYAWQGAYCASKFALEGWSEALLLETQDQGINVYLIEPGVTRSRFGDNLRHVVASGRYVATAARFIELREKLRRRAQPAERVAQTVLRTAQYRRAPFRQTVGSDAAWVARLQSWLPASAYLALNRWLARRLFGLGKP